MLISRGAQILKTASLFKKVEPVAINLKQVRYDWTYRSVPHPDRWTIVLAELTGGFGWWWVLWNLWHEHKVLLHGEVPGSIPEHWTDEELGIPPDD
ncbi:NADH dehydrogenase [ubiquinone] 1 beta subcomplex subunit 2, mitochondrial-like [Colletes gigas]|uniref:NADH dehydrogenase [ubiquinone] 1 beta subcomplex subunit 2, mitochondrial-like n=1 Tax=Colletes gigas TaxID=935657 RepID=UPI001C9B0316|nr:NADH dehydrogenase [ubiquinone] 1 beta subcomplex subunit 2, mitochondrial-like [Colletes gigas]